MALVVSFVYNNLDFWFLLIVYLTLIFGTTDIPGTTIYSFESIFSSKTIFTGILCTIFTNEPTAFSGGNKLDFAPELR